ncbi:hypothetical protein CABS03_07084 [Colletotrichum abscissum]|uniref:Uncharacterized protein n=2 Tax=Colletotrichum acutatum species complex TaxID=2707335 RepID=A0A9P9XJB1_9PEZI|nr:hypothetical protein CABS02_05393 [Colletotrichum abscissum]
MANLQTAQRTGFPSRARICAALAWPWGPACTTVTLKSSRYCAAVPPTLSNNAHPGFRDPCSTSAGRGGISVMPAASPLKASMLLLLALRTWI